MKERPIIFSAPMVRAILSGTKTQTRRVVRDPKRLEGLMLAGEEAEWCPYGGGGDRLWVRETHYVESDRLILYRADDKLGDYPVSRWTSAIHMPRWASRLTLEITRVRVERLQEITFIDAKAEGVEYEKGYTDPRDAYRALWDSLNAKRAPWAANPCVWVVEFRRVPYEDRDHEDREALRVLRRRSRRCRREVPAR